MRVDTVGREEETACLLYAGHSSAKWNYIFKNCQKKYCREKIEVPGFKLYPPDSKTLVSFPTVSDLEGKKILELKYFKPSKGNSGPEVPSSGLSSSLRSQPSPRFL